MINEYALNQINRIAEECKGRGVKVAIECATYNHGSYLADALEGFVNQQTNFPFVAIVHDDASTDNTADVLREYAAKYPDIIKPIYEQENQYSKHNGSLTRIMRDGCERTGAPYIAFCEGDDYWTDNLKLQKQVDFLDRNPDYSMCFSNALVRWEDKRMPESHRTFLQGGTVEGIELYKKWCVATASIIVRTSTYESDCYKRLRALPKLTFGDVIIVMSAASIGKIWYMDEVMTCYRRLSTGAGALFEQDRWLQCNSGIRVAKVLGKEFVKAEQRTTSKYFINALFNPFQNFPNNLKLVVRVFWFAPLDCMRELTWVGKVIKSKFK